ncbi:MAG TPA: hypothetical protein VF092_02215 [Longimicrobium sp.]
MATLACLGCAAAPARIHAQDTDSAYFGKAAQLYGHLLAGVRSVAVYDSTRQARQMQEQRDSLRRLEASVSNRPGLGRLHDNLRDLLTWMNSGAAPDRDTSLVMEDVRTAAGDAKILSQRVARRVGMSQAVAQMRFALQTHNHLGLLSLYQEFLAARQEWELGRIREFITRTDQRLRLNDSLTVVRINAILHIVGFEGSIQDWQTSTMSSSSVWLGPVVYTNQAAGGGVLMRKRRWVAALETAVDAGGSESLAAGVSLGRDVGTVSALVGVLLTRAGALQGAGAATLVLRRFPGVQPGVTLTSRGAVGLKVFFRP